MTSRKAALIAVVLSATALLGGCVYEQPAYPSYAAAYPPYPYSGYYGGYPYYGPTVGVGLGFGFGEGWHEHRGWHGGGHWR